MLLLASHSLSLRDVLGSVVLVVLERPPLLARRQIRQLVVVRAELTGLIRLARALLLLLAVAAVRACRHDRHLLVR